MKSYLLTSRFLLSSGPRSMKSPAVGVRVQIYSASLSPTMKGKTMQLKSEHCYFGAVTTESCNSFSPSGHFIHFTRKTAHIEFDKHGTLPPERERVHNPVNRTQMENSFHVLFPRCFLKILYLPLIACYT